MIAQTANILQYLGPRLGLVPESEARDCMRIQLQLTIADLVAEVHDSHHPIAGCSTTKTSGRSETRAADLRKKRLPKYLGYFEQILERADGRHALRDHSYVDLSLFQLMRGLEYAFPRAMQRLAPKLPRLRALADRVTGDRAWRPIWPRRGD